jgi:hypothetical protein
MLNRQDSLRSNATADDVFYSADQDDIQHICMSTSCASSFDSRSVFNVEDISKNTTRWDVLS